VCNSGFLYPCRWYNDFSQKFATRAPKKCQKKISNLKTLWKMESKIHLQSVFCFKVSRSDTEHFCLLYIGTCFRDTFVFRIWQKCLLILKLFWFSTLLLCVVKRCINMSFKVKTNVQFFNMKVNYKFLCILCGFKLSRRPITEGAI